MAKPNVISLYSDLSTSQTVRSPAKLAAALAAGHAHRFSAAREHPELYTAPPPTRSPSTRAFSFPSHPSFTPNLSPAEVLRAGAFGGSYFRPIASSVRALVLLDAARELPPAWLEGGIKCEGTVYNPSLNKYGVKCGADLAEWEGSGWVTEIDPFGWFQWFCRFFAGRRCWDDDRQISRWEKVCGGKGRWRNNLIAKCVAAGAAFDDASVSPVVRQTLLHWGYELTASDFERYAKKVKKGARTSFIRGGVVVAPGGGGGSGSGSGRGGAAAAAPPKATGRKRGRGSED